MTQSTKSAYPYIAPLRFGVELELADIQRPLAAQVIAEVVGGCVLHTSRSLGYSSWSVDAPDGRRWRCFSDASIEGAVPGGCEVISPILGIDDIPVLQEIVRRLRCAGARADASCGLHVHVGAEDMDAACIARLIKLFWSQELLTFAAFQVRESRLNHYTQPTEPWVLQAAVRGFTSMKEVNCAWFGYYCPRPEHYNSARYHALNLNNLWNDKHTVEFRLFNSTTHAGELRAAVLFALSVVALAKRTKKASAKRRLVTESSSKYDMRGFLLRLGWRGEYFKAPFEHVLKHLSGDISFKNSDDRRRARERDRERRRAAAGTQG